jgi:hypothetical protein
MGVHALTHSIVVGHSAVRCQRHGRNNARGGIEHPGPSSPRLCHRRRLREMKFSESPILDHCGDDTCLPAKLTATVSDHHSDAVVRSVPLKGKHTRACRRRSRCRCSQSQRANQKGILSPFPFQHLAHVRIGVPCRPILSRPPASCGRAENCLRQS